MWWVRDADGAEGWAPSQVFARLDLGDALALGLE